MSKKRQNNSLNYSHIMSDDNPSTSGISYEQIQHLIDERISRIHERGSSLAASHLPPGRTQKRSWYKRFRQLLGMSAHDKPK
ncbi:MAG TPA: hypothetical protein DCQ56_03265 [Porphyromonadaceae bacterium]|nr:hypothetical protein [Porphyromonadaceae bacterium]